MGCGGSKSTEVEVLEVEKDERGLAKNDKEGEKEKQAGASPAAKESDADVKESNADVKDSNADVKESNKVANLPNQTSGGGNEKDCKQEAKAAKKPSVGTLKFSVARRDVTGKGVSEVLYAVEMEWAARVWSRWHHSLESPPMHLDALQTDTGFCRNTLQILKPAVVRSNVEWRHWQKWRPVGRGMVPVAGVSWTLGQQLGVIDDLVFDGAEPALPSAQAGKEAAAAARGKRQADKPPPQDKICDCVRARAKRFGVSVESVTSDGHCVVVALPGPREEMPDPCLASGEDLAEWLPDLLLKNPDEEEGCLVMARWQYALRERKKYMAQLPRAGCWNDLPFYSLVEPLSARNKGLPLCKRRHEPPPSEQPPSPEQYTAELAKASETSLGESEAEAARMALVKSLKWSVELPSNFWHADPATSKWARTKPDMLRIDYERLEKEAPLDFELPEGGALARSEFPVIGITVEGEAVEVWEETLRNGGVSEFLDLTLVVPVWTELPLNVIPEDVLCEGQKKPRARRAMTEERWKKIKEKGLPEIFGLLPEDYSPEKPLTWMTEKLVPEDYSPKVAAAERKVRRQSFDEECAKKRQRREEVGATLAAWPSNRKWLPLEPSEKGRKMVERLRLLEMQRKGGSPNQQEPEP